MPVPSSWNEVALHQFLGEETRQDQEGEQHANDGLGGCGKRPLVKLQSFNHGNLSSTWPIASAILVANR